MTPDEVTFQIRAAAVADIGSIFALDQSVETAPHWPVAEYLATFSAAFTPALSPSEGDPQTFIMTRCLLVAENASGVVGFAVGKVTVIHVEGSAEVSAELESLAVAEAARRSGIGRALCGAVFGWSRERGASEIVLEVRSRSAGPIALYEQLGFLAVGKRTKYYRGPVDDAILMRLGLASEASIDRDL